MAKRIFAAVSMILMIGALAFAGGGGDKAGAGGAKPVTLRFSWWGADVRHQATLQAIDRYMELHPNVTIEGEYQGFDGYPQKIMTQIAGRTEPDLMQLDYVWFPELAARGDTFVDMTTQSAVDLSPYSQKILEEYCSINGKIISLPMGTNGWGLMVNREFYKKYNLAPDTDWTWEKVIDEGARIHKANPNDYLFSIPSNIIFEFFLSPYIYTKTGHWWVDEGANKISATRAELLEGFTVLKKLYDGGAAQPIGEANLFMNQMNPKWAGGQLGFMINWSGVIQQHKEMLPEGAFTVAKPPYAANGKNKSIPFKVAMVLAVSNRSPNVAVAADFANWLLNDPEAITILGTQRSVPTNQNAFNQLNKAGSINADMAAMVAFTNADPLPPFPMIQSNSEVTDIVKDICEQVVFGKLTPEAATDKFLADVQEKMDALKKSR
ncbi:sugar ABC transporter substrate-binding protein [Spirochaetia bacterium]|nr:sugar ABC transporter substrate-binding protein [Spirochaetia bacterium]